MKASFVAGILIFFLFLLTAGYTLYIHELPKQSNTWFSSSGVCVLCHSTSDFALRDTDGNDVSPVSRWRSTMLANASKDPFWRAKVKHEGIENPSHKDALENVCTRCHAPMGMLNAFLSQNSVYTLDSLKNDDLGKDGISCTVCHQINDIFLPDFSGNFGINSDREIYGPYENPLVTQMFLNSGYTPVYSEIINESRLCGSCHTLFTHSADQYGKPTGEMFVEQALYHEWENSIYRAEKISCQSCHIPQIHDPVKISSRPGFVTARKPFGIHDFTGGNVFMLQLLKANHDILNLHSGEEFISHSINRTKKMLTEKTIDLSIGSITIYNDSVFVEVMLENKAGHKFPTGFPSRRAYLEFMATDSNDTLFHSGERGASALIYRGEKEFEPHHEDITSEDQVQIYEFVMGDTQGDITTVLEKAYRPLKDNRIVPRGFSSDHINYDTVRVVGKAALDSDYFSTHGIETVIYSFPMNRESILIEVLLHYETVPESWLTDMFMYSERDENINLFKEIYQKSDRTPEVVASDSRLIAATHHTADENSHIRIYPNPSNGVIWIKGADNDGTYSIFTLEGVKLSSGKFHRSEMPLHLDLPSGNYILRIDSEGNAYTMKLVIIN